MVYAAQVRHAANSLSDLRTFALRRRSRKKPRFLPAIDGAMSEKRPQAIFPVD
jgi:hypothetical protein